MRKYCKAYHLGDLRQFPGWKETTEQSDTPSLMRLLSTCGMISL